MAGTWYLKTQDQTSPRRVVGTQLQKREHHRIIRYRQLKASEDWVFLQQEGQTASTIQFNVFDVSRTRSFTNRRYVCSSDRQDWEPSQCIWIQTQVWEYFGPWQTDNTNFGS